MPEIGRTRLPYISIGADGIIKFEHHALPLNPILQSRVVGDAFPRFELRADGSIYWGSGAGAMDAYFRRVAASVLGTGDTIQTNKSFRGGFDAALGSAALVSRVSGDAVSRFEIDNTGKMEWGPGNAALDVNLYRSATNMLYSDDGIHTKYGFRGAYGSASGTNAFVTEVAGDTTPRLVIDNTGLVTFGPGNAPRDVSISRGGANLLDFTVNSVVGARISNTAVALDTFLMVHDVDNNNLERVSVGVADSGGAGFKLLRIAN